MRWSCRSAVAVLGCVVSVLATTASTASAVVDDHDGRMTAREARSYARAGAAKEMRARGVRSRAARWSARCRRTAGERFEGMHFDIFQCAVSEFPCSGTLRVSERWEFAYRVRIRCGH